MDSSDKTLSEALASVPAKALNFSSRLVLANHLNNKQVFTSKEGYARDYRGLAELMDFPVNATKCFERSEDPTSKILEAWEIQPDATLGQLIYYLEKMERYDVIGEIIPLVEKNANSYLRSQQHIQECPIQVPEVTSCRTDMNNGSDLEAYTKDDLQFKEPVTYTAYVTYADEDCSFVYGLAKYLESPEVGLKLLIPGRDLLAGWSEHDTNIKLIKERCQRMMIILSPNFLKSPACEFYASFAASLAVDQRKRMLIPILIAPCEIPLILRFVSKIDFTKSDIYEWVMGRLIKSLLPEGSSHMFVSSGDKGSFQQTALQQGNYISSPSNPVITFPPTRCLPSSCENLPFISAPSTSSILCEAVKNQPVASSKPSTSQKRWKFPSLRGRSSNYSSSISSASSNATSGFHSQSRDIFENLESSEDFSNDTPV